MSADASVPAAPLDRAQRLERPGRARAPLRPARRDWSSVVVRALSLIAAVALWHSAAVWHADLRIVTFRNVPSPAEVARAAGALLASPKLLFHVRSSLGRVLGGFAAAAVVGIAFGLVIGRARRARDLLLPTLEVLRPIPGVAWIPLAILMFPSSELSMVFITFMGALFPILLNTIHGVETIDQRLIIASRSLGARSLALFSDVILPGALPSVMTGLSIGMGTAWFCLVTAEMIAGQYGIGYYTWESYNLQQYPEIVVGMLFIGVFGMLSSALVKHGGALLMPWYRPEPRGRSA